MCVQLNVSEGIAWVTIDRSDKGNSVNVEVHETLRKLWPQLELDDAIGVVVISGSGDRSFCAGADIASFLPYLAERIANGEDPCDFCGLTHRQLQKPLIAAINGAAIGGGLEIALAADLRIASLNAVFGLPEVRIGAIAGAGGVTRLPRAVPAAVANEMILTGRSITAQRAYEVGLVSRVVDLAELHSAAEDMARAILANSPTAVSSSRKVMLETDGKPLTEALLIEREEFRAITASPDFEVGISSFREGRKPQFGRH